MNQKDMEEVFSKEASSFCKGKLWRDANVPLMPGENPDNSVCMPELKGYIEMFIENNFPEELPDIVIERDVYDPLKFIVTIGGIN